MAAVTALCEAYGAELTVSAPDARSLQELLAGLPPGWTCHNLAEPHHTAAWRFTLTQTEGSYRTLTSENTGQVCADACAAASILRNHVRRYVGYHAPGLVFVHAGVVVSRGRAIVLPGSSFAGKSTLVAALVRAGADFYSDEFAVLDRHGAVMQYHDPLILRGPTGREEQTLQAAAVPRPVPVALVALTNYTPGATWEPRRLSVGAGVLATLEHALPARDRPEETLATLRVALADAEVLAGPRGEADQTAPLLLAALSARSRGPRRV